ncbi:twin-arginine translocation signal domain-containing protein [Halorientalis pallida]|uniref:Twin-arginine translocation signal domain-containing protein n=1 Tax=Halorientalis pallida TaxID=2479928 RepID=A0A498KUB1_9EURY|nr:twin-arginine translocation signal domain-containing protein [Halorientalis pallida]RXK46954.1 twin-arginine translocation signal domain-containing protein [Halorientalis pallida]
MGKSSSEDGESGAEISRRQALQGIGVGGGAVVGGAGLTEIGMGVLGYGGGSYSWRPSCPKGQVLHAKYEVKDDERFELQEHESRGDALDAVDDSDPLVEFTVTERKGNGEVLSFEADTSPYYMNKMEVKFNGSSEVVEVDEAQNHFEFENPGNHAVSHVYFCKKVYMQIDLFAGGEDDIKKPPTYDWESDNLIKAAMANSVDGVVSSSPLTKNYDPVLGGALQDREIHFEVDWEWFFETGIVAAYLPDIPKDPDIEEPELVKEAHSKRYIELTLAVYERTGPEGEGRSGSFQPELQRYVDSHTRWVQFGFFSQFDLEADTPKAVENLPD